MAYKNTPFPKQYTILSNKWGAVQNVDEAFNVMIIALIESKRYQQINIVDIIQDFNDKFGFSIPYFPMMRLLSNLCRKKILKRTHNRYLVNLDNEALDSIGESFWNDLENQERNQKMLLNRYVQFIATKYSEEITIEDAARVFNAFIEENGVVFIKNHEYEKSTTETYRFCVLLKELETSDGKLFAFVESAIVGRILSELVIFTGDRIDLKKSNAKVFLDTNIIFKLLGISTIDRSEYYKKLIKDMIDIGFKPYVYQHTYSEIVTILSSSEYWIGNYQFDPSKSSEATSYYIMNGKSRENVELQIANLQDDLESLGIYVYDMDYPQRIPVGVTDDKTYYDKIVSEYKRTNSQFNEGEMRNTVWDDAKSFFFTDFLNAGQNAFSFAGIQNIFVTHNETLSKVSKIQLSESGSKVEAAIPFCVSDVFWGNLIWANSSESLSIAGKQRLMTIVAAAFEPTVAVLHRLKEELDKLEKENKITKENCYFLKSNRMALDMLVRITEGDASKFTDSTPFEILDKIRSEAKDEGIKEEKVRNETEKHEIRKAHEKLECEHEEKYLKQLEQEKRDIDAQYQSLDGEKARLDKEKEKLKMCQKECVQKATKRCEHIRMAFLIGIVLWLIVGVVLLMKFNVLYSCVELIFGILVTLIFNNKLASWIIKDADLQEKIALIQNYEKMKEALILQYYKREKCTLKEIMQIEKQLSSIQVKKDDLARRTQENFEKQCEARGKIEKLKNSCVE